MVCLRSYALLAIAGYAGPDGGLRAMGGAGEELLGATLYGTYGRRPNQGCGPRAAAEATRYNVTKPNRLRTYRDAGCELASGAAGLSTRQAGASTSRRHWPWTRMESRASSGPEEKYDIGAVMRTSDGRSNRRFVYATTGHGGLQHGRGGLQQWSHTGRVATHAVCLCKECVLD